MDDEEAALKAKLDQTEDINERLELRKQIREIRNRKFDEELKKISSGEASSSKLTNDINSRKSIRRNDTSAETTGDPYGLLAYTSEQALQDLLDDTPYTETDKRRKIRARMREVRNAEFDNAVVDSSRNKTETGGGDSSTRGSIRQPSPEPTKRTLREPVREPSPEPVREPSPEPIREPSPEPIREPSPEPIREPSPEPIREPSPEPIREPSPEPIREPSPESLSPSPEPTREPSPEPRDSSPEPERESSEPVRESSPDYYRQPTKSHNRHEYTRDPSPQMESDQRSNSESEYEEELTEGRHSYDDADSDEMNKDSIDGRNEMKKVNHRSEVDYDSDYREPHAAIVEKVLQSAEPGIKDGSDFKERLKRRQDSHEPLNLERSVNTGGEQVDFRRSLKRKTESPAVDLERKTEGPEQVDFRTAALARKVEPVVKNEETGGVQVDFRTALKKKVEKPVFDKSPMPAAQVDFRNNLVKKVQTRTMEDKNLGCEQKDFRLVLGKAPPSPKTGRRHKSLNMQESVDRTTDDLERDSYYAESDLSALRETPSPDIQNIAFKTEEEERKVESPVIEHEMDSPKLSLIRKASKKAPPPPPAKKKVVSSKTEPTEKTSDVHIENIKENIVPVSSRDTHTINNNEHDVCSDSAPEEFVRQESIDADIRVEDRLELEHDIHRTQQKEGSDDEVDGLARNRQIARAERARRRQAKEAAEKAKESQTIPSETARKEEEVKSGEEQTYRRSRRKEESPSEARSERLTRRSRRLAALGDGQADEQKKVQQTPNDEKEEEHNHNMQPEVNGNTEHTSEVPSSTMNGVHDKHEGEEAEEQLVVTEAVESEAEVCPAVNGDAKAESDENVSRTESRKSKKEKEEKPSVSADLLAEINKPKDETPKKSIESQLRKSTPRATNLTGKAAEREAERLKREAEREERAAARAREREEAARKRREQKEAFEKKMAEQKRAREIKQRSNITRVGSNTRDSRKAFKEKLESNSPAPASPVPSLSVNSNLTKLLGWARKRTRDYEGVNVENFHDSWSDGLAFAALIHSFCPDLIPIDELDKTTRRRNFELAFSVARDEGVMDLLDVEDMVRMRSPDPKSVMTYVHSVYQTFQETTT